MRDWQRETTYFSCFTSFGPTRRWRYSTCSPLSLGSQPPAGMPSHCITLRKSRAEVLQQVFLETAKDFFSFLVVSFSASFCLWMLQIPRQRWWQWWWESFVVPLSAQVRAWRYCLSAFFFVQTWLITVEAVPMASTVVKSFSVCVGLHNHRMSVPLSVSLYLSRYCLVRPSVWLRLRSVPHWLIYHPVHQMLRDEKITTRKVQPSTTTAK